MLVVLIVTTIVFGARGNTTVVIVLVVLVLVLAAVVAIVYLVLRRKGDACPQNCGQPPSPSPQTAFVNAVTAQIGVSTWLAAEELR